MQRRPRWARGCNNLHVELWDPVLVHQSRKHGERRACLCNDGDRHGSAHSILPLLHLEIIQKGGQDILRANRLSNVAKRVDGSASDGFLVCFQHVKQLKTDAHPLACGHEFRAAVRDPSNQVNAILLHNLVSVLEDWRETWEQILDGRCHLRHSDDINDCFESTNDRAEHLQEVNTPKDIIEKNGQSKPSRIGHG